MQLPFARLATLDEWPFRTQATFQHRGILEFEICTVSSSVFAIDEPSLARSRATEQHECICCRDQCHSGESVLVSRACEAMSACSSRRLCIEFVDIQFVEAVTVNSGGNQ